MMDISMYGNHHTNHSSGFQSPDLGTGGYPYFPTGHHHHHLQNHQNVQAAYAASSNVLTTASIQTASNGNSGNHFYSSAIAHPHLYSPTAIEYGIHTSSNNSPSEQYDKYYDAQSNDGYYTTTGTGSSTAVVTNNNNNNNNNNTNSGSPETHIISSDNGLSYTNLDYIAYQQAHHNQAQGYNIAISSSDDKLTLNHHYNEELLLNNPQNPLHHHHQHHHNAKIAANNPWHHTNSSNHNFMDAPGTLVNQMQAISGNNLTTQQTLQQHAMHSPNSIQSSSPTLQNQQQQDSNGQLIQQQSTAPTYKWMQVKRNVPKPQTPKLAPTIDYTAVPSSIDPCRTGLFNSLMGK
ncbi:hypothetical protein ACKWTF_013181 [Chironomus riparius]